MVVIVKYGRLDAVTIGQADKTSAYAGITSDFHIRKRGMAVFGHIRRLPEQVRGNATLCPAVSRRSICKS